MFRVTSWTSRTIKWSWYHLPEVGTAISTTKLLEKRCAFDSRRTLRWEWPSTRIQKVRLNVEHNSCKKLPIYPMGEYAINVIAMLTQHDILYWKYIEIKQTEDDNQQIKTIQLIYCFTVRLSVNFYVILWILLNILSFFRNRYNFFFSLGFHDHSITVIINVF